jgi:thiamine-phosphate pyrophosphorylase
MKLPSPCLTLITDRRLCQSLSLEEAVARATGGGINVVQLREKDLAAAELVPLADHLRAITRDKALLIVNSHLDVALLCGADGVHLPERGPSVAATRRLAGDGLIIGRSVHSAEEAVKAEEEGADYVQVGAIFPTRSHPGPPAGPGLVESVAVRVSIPIVAVGGITARNVGQVMQAGARGAAVISAILGSPSPGAAARRLAEAMVEAAAVAVRRTKS